MKNIFIFALAFAAWGGMPVKAANTTPKLKNEDLIEYDLFKRTCTNVKNKIVANHVNHDPMCDSSYRFLHDYYESPCYKNRQWCDDTIYLPKPIATKTWQYFFDKLKAAAEKAGKEGKTKEKEDYETEKNAYQDELGLPETTPTK